MSHRNLSPDEFGSVLPFERSRKGLMKRAAAGECEHPEDEVDFHDDGSMSCGICGEGAPSADEELELTTKPEPPRHLRPL